MTERARRPRGAARGRRPLHLYYRPHEDALSRMLLVRLDGALVPVLASLLLAAFPGLLIERDGRRRPLAVAALWTCALAVMLINAAVFAVGDDEVFYLADSWAARNGETSGALPLR